MKKISKIKILIIATLIIFVFVFGFSSVVKADTGTVINLDDYTTIEETDDEQEEQQQEEDIVQKETQEAQEEIPQTGVVEDTIVATLIITCVILAIYAYKKVKQYNY